MAPRETPALCAPAAFIYGYSELLRTIDKSSCPGSYLRPSSARIQFSGALNTLSPSVADPMTRSSLRCSPSIFERAIFGLCRMALRHARESMTPARMCSGIGSAR